MLDPPDLPIDAIVAAIRAHYGIGASGLEFLPIGNDSSSWVFRLDALDGERYFVKLRKGGVNQLSLVVPRYLQDSGAARLVVPLPTAARNLWIDLGTFTAIVYPFIEGTTGAETELSAQQQAECGAILREIHRFVCSSTLLEIVNREGFVPKWASMVRALDKHIDARAPGDALESNLATCWRAWRKEIWTLVHRAEMLGDRLRASSVPMVLCHGDLHKGNILLDTTDQLWIVDWDETILAPKERDLVFWTNEIPGRSTKSGGEAWFLQGYGDTTIDPLVLTYYRCALALGEIGDYATRVLLMPELSAESKREATQEFANLFRAGNLVAVALESDVCADGWAREVKD